MTKAFATVLIAAVAAASSSHTRDLIANAVPSTDSILKLSQMGKINHTNLSQVQSKMSNIERQPFQAMEFAQAESQLQVKCWDCEYNKKVEAKLAQLRAEGKLEAVSGHTCQTAPNRAKAAVDDFWTIRGQTGAWTDTDFAADAGSLAWKDFNEGDYSSYKWGRLGQTQTNLSIFGDGISVDDIHQGQLGNCWTLSAASAVAEKKGRMEAAWLNTENIANP